MHFLLHGRFIGTLCIFIFSHNYYYSLLYFTALEAELSANLNREREAQVGVAIPEVLTIKAHHKILQFLKSK